MNLNSALLVASSAAYIALLYGLGWAARQTWFPQKLSRHPIVYILSLGVFASAWSLYGITELALEQGYGALAYFLGTGTVFLFAPIALTPLVDLCRRFQLRSLADLLVFRYHSNSAGIIATALMFFALLPLLAAQIQSVAASFEVLSHSGHGDTPWHHSNRLFSWAYVLVVALITLSISAYKQNKHSLPVVLAFDTLVKVIAINLIGALAVFSVFDGFDGLDTWLQQHPENLQLLYSPLQDTASHTLLLVFIASTLIMPQMFYSAVVAQPDNRIVHSLSWAFPLLLLIMALPMFPILWAGFELGVPTSPEYFSLGIPLLLKHPSLALLMYLAGLSAATTALITIAANLATMMLNHWLLPLTGIRRNRNINQQLLKLRRLAVGFIFLSGFVLSQVLYDSFSLTDLALLCFIAGCQFVPGLIAVVYWPRGHSRGLVGGLIAGLSVWLLGLFIPALAGIDQISILGLQLNIGLHYWDSMTLLSLSLNSLVFVAASYYWQASEAESYSAQLCAEDELSRPLRDRLNVFSVADFQRHLAEPLGVELARAEIEKALTQLSLQYSERRPYALRRLRQRLESNLSGLLGIRVASDIMSRHIPLVSTDSSIISTDVKLIETRLDKNSIELKGVALALNHLRLYHRNTLQELPMAVCALGSDLEIVMWNQAMGQLTQLSPEAISGSHLDDLPEPWQPLIAEFLTNGSTHLANQEVQLDGSPHWISLHKSEIRSPTGTTPIGTVILLEDVSETHRLELELMHSERLASVGRLAAGVAHEIGNPVTGIACLAQNIKYDSGDPDVLETAQQILSQTDRITRIVQSLVNFSHSGQTEPQQFQAVDLRLCAEEAIGLLSLQHHQIQVRYHNRIKPGALIKGDSQRLIQVFVNLLSNARDASPDGGEICLEQEIDQQQLKISVSDQGPGIAADIIDRILEPFFTTKDPGEGTGLGLAMVFSIMEEHGAQLEVQNLICNEAVSGAQFILKFPLELETDH